MTTERWALVPEDMTDAQRDMLSGWRYIRAAHGDLYGVGWDRAQTKAEAALAKYAPERNEHPALTGTVFESIGLDDVPFPATKKEPTP